MLHQPRDNEVHNNEMDWERSNFGDLVKVLLRAHRLAEDVGRFKWDFATDIKSLEKAGGTDADFRWLLCSGFLEHRKEVTRTRDDHRQFRETHQLKFSRKSC